ncbi:DUF3108 domain-containing protein [Aquifex sp.]
MKFLLILLFPLLMFGNSLELCFKAYYLIFPVGYSCLKLLETPEGNLVIQGNTRSVFLGSIFRKIRISARSETEKNLTSRRFNLELTSGSYRKLHSYEFEGNSVRYEIIVEKERSAQVIRGTKKIKNPSDPLTASLFVYLNASPKNTKHTFFYDGKEQSVEFVVVGRETLERLGRTWNTLKVKVIPRVKTSGLLVPKGTWFVWIDEETRIPVRMKMSFTLGSANAWIDSIEGDLRLFYSLKESSQRKP